MASDTEILVLRSRQGAQNSPYWTIVSSEQWARGDTHSWHEVQKLACGGSKLW